MKSEYLEPHKLGAASLNEDQPEKFVIKDLREFQDAIASAQLDGQEYIQVDEKVFKYFNKKNPDAESFMYGNPGIRVFRGGVDIGKILQHESRILL